MQNDGKKVPAVDQNAGSPVAEQDKKTDVKGVNPVLAVAIAIGISLVLTTISVTLYLRSDTRRNIKLIQKPASEEVSNASIDEASPLKSSDLSGIQAAIKKDLDPLRNDVDFNPNELTDAALGL